MLLPLWGKGQPMLNSKIEVEGFQLFQDWKDSSLYYYLPPPLKLKTEDEGRPDFQFLAMRYTGTSCRDDAGEVSFLSLAQFTLERQPQDKNLIYQVQRSMRASEGKWIELRPMPLRGISAQLIAPVGSHPDGKSRHSKVGGVDLGDGGPSEWEEKTFTLRLDPHEAQLLIENMEKRQLALSFSYTYLAEAIPGLGSEVNLVGDSGALAQLEQLEGKMIRERDTTPASLPVYANSLAIEADVKRWPQNLKKIDVNAEGFPGGFPAIEIRCYDFADRLRPDLAIKRLTLQAYTLGGQLARPLTYQFREAEKEEVVRQVKFPVALDMSRGYRYKVTEISATGDIQESPGWIEADFCQGLLDLTAHPEENPILHHSLDLEVSSEEIREASIRELRLVFSYSFGGKSHRREVTLGASQDFQSIELAYDREEGLEATLFWEYKNGYTKKRALAVGEKDDYFYLSPRGL